MFSEVHPDGLRVNSEQGGNLVELETLLQGGLESFWGDVWGYGS